jgi:thymidylate synthase
MRVLEVRNVNEALPKGLDILFKHGVRRNSRNGEVFVYPTPVTTAYSHPLERVLFDRRRDANPFFHLYESLWMLNGRWDVQPLTRYVKRFKDFSDDGESLHGAYGRRWRKLFALPNGEGTDQLAIIAETLIKNPDDRRCVLQMWSASNDLGSPSKDVPCNLMITFQVNALNCLDMTVFCRSNDIVWGAYGANAVHFAFLLEYMALWINRPVGSMYQISVNWHGYLKTIEPLKELAMPIVPHNPYPTTVRYVPMALDGDINRVNELLLDLIEDADTHYPTPAQPEDDSPWAQMVWRMLSAHEIYKRESVDAALRHLYDADTSIDWIKAGILWLERRNKKA